jgi:hypothetical protein
MGKRELLRRAMTGYTALSSGNSPPQVLRQPMMLVCGFGHVAA